MTDQMFIAVHKCACDDPECTARILMGYGSTVEELKNSIAEHWDNLYSEDPNFARFEVYTRTGYFALQRETNFHEVKVN